MDMKKRQRAKKVHKVDEFGVVDSLSLAARVGLQNLATEFIQSCFNRTLYFPRAVLSTDLWKAFLSAILKDIRSERPKITEKDNLRLLFVTKWFLQFFQEMHLKAKEANKDMDTWNFGLVAELTERAWIVWILKRMREAVEEKVGMTFANRLWHLTNCAMCSQNYGPNFREA
jgi:replication fork protection complex subunit Tof1/Swi1